MATVDERVVLLEGRVNEQSQMMNGIREAVENLGRHVAIFEERVLLAVVAALAAR